jgi:hypothetical protein
VILNPDDFAASLEIAYVQSGYDVTKVLEARELYSLIEAGETGPLKENLVGQFLAASHCSTCRRPLRRSGVVCPCRPKVSWSPW